MWLNADLEALSRVPFTSEDGIGSEEREHFRYKSEKHDGCLLL